MKQTSHYASTHVSTHPIVILSCWPFLPVMFSQVFVILSLNGGGGGGGEVGNTNGQPPPPRTKVMTPPPWTKGITPPPPRTNHHTPPPLDQSHHTSPPGTMGRRAVRILLECILVLLKIAWKLKNLNPMGWRGESPPPPFQPVLPLNLHVTSHHP